MSTENYHCNCFLCGKLIEDGTFASIVEERIHSGKLLDEGIVMNNICLECLDIWYKAPEQLQRSISHNKAQIGIIEDYGKLTDKKFKENFELRMEVSKLKIDLKYTNYYKALLLVIALFNITVMYFLISGG